MGGTSGIYPYSLTVYDINGHSDTSISNITIYPKIEVSVYDVQDTLPCNTTQTSIQLSASSNISNPSYTWKYNTGLGDKTSLSATPISLSTAGVHDAYVYVTDLDNGCISETEHLIVTIHDTSVKINDFSITPQSYSTTAMDIDYTLSWNVSGVSGVYIDNGIGNRPAIGSETFTISRPNSGVYTYNLSATDGSCVVFDTAMGSYEFINEPVTLCITKNKYIKTYGLDELKYGKDRELQLIPYLPDYIKNSDISEILLEFEVDYKIDDSVKTLNDYLSRRNEE